MNIWQIIAILFIGFGIGLFIGFRFAPAKTNYTLRKLKNKQKGTDNESNFTANIKPETREKKERRIRIFRNRRRKI